LTPLESKLYTALLGARTIVSATANVNPRVLKVLRYMDEAAQQYKAAKEQERERPVPELEERADADGD